MPLYWLNSLIITKIIWDKWLQNNAWDKKTELVNFLHLVYSINYNIFIYFCFIQINNII